LVTVAILGFALVATLVGLVGSGSLGIGLSTTTTSSPGAALSPYSPFVPEEARAVQAANSDVNVKLPQSVGAPSPVLPSAAFTKSLGSRVVLGFLPSWQLGDVGSVDYTALSEIAYFGIEAEPHGAILHRGYGWSGLGSSSVATLVADAHAHGVRALLSVFSNTNSTLDALAADPVASGTALATSTAALIRQHSFDGVDLDLEGLHTSARAGFVRFMTVFSSRFRSIDPSLSIVLNTFPQSAIDPTSFFDVKALNASVDQFFVMAYEMGDLSIPGPTAPLEGAALSDASALATYAAAVPPSKVILGIPFYGYDFQATRPKPPADSEGSPVSVTYTGVVEAARPGLWDPVSETPFTSFRRAGHWHQTWYENPVSVALKVALASQFRVGGVGVWELGMASGEPEMSRVLDGGASPARLGLAS
ncbi:MAG: glycosyl hydrolase family 18 protein, partial [Acidimicrobiales bacterium]